MCRRWARPAPRAAAEAHGSATSSPLKVVPTPLMTSCFPPSGAVEAPAGQEAATFALDRVLGFNPNGQCNNVKFSSQGHVVYTAATVAVIVNPEDNEQHFHQGHQHEIVSLALAPAGDIAATGELATKGNKMEIRIWKLETGELLQSITTTDSDEKQGHLLAGSLELLSFSPDGTRLVAFGKDKMHCIACFATEDDWASYHRVFHVKGTSKSTLFCTWMSATSFVTGGPSFIYEWNELGQRTMYKLPEEDVFTNGLTLEKAAGGEEEEEGAEPSDSKMLVVTSASGKLHVYEKGILVKSVMPESESPIFSAVVHQGGFVTANSDGAVTFWNEQLEPVNSLKMSQLLSQAMPDVRLTSVSFLDEGKKLLLANESSDIVMMTVSGVNKVKDVAFVNHCHKGAVHGCCFHPIDHQMLLSVSDDCSLYQHDLEKKRTVKKVELCSPGRCIAISHAGDKLAVGFGCTSGSVEETVGIYSYPELKPLALLNSYCQGAATSVQFSPDDHLVGATFSDGSSAVFQLVEAEAGVFHLTPCPLSSCGPKPATRMDFSVDGSMVRVQFDVAAMTYYELQKGETGLPVPRASNVRDVQWNTCTCTVNHMTQGIWKDPETAETFTCSALSHDGKVLAALGHLGSIYFFQYPCLFTEHDSAKVLGHSYPPTVCQFDAKDLYLATCGGPDGTIMIWKTNKEEVAEEEESGVSDVDAQAEHEEETM